MPRPDGRPAEPGIEDFLDRPTHDLGRWRWLWEGDHEFPLRSHRPVLGRLLVAFKRLLRPLVRSPQSDLWDRQRAYNLVVLSHLEGLGRRIEDLGRDLQQVQSEILSDLRDVQADFIRDRGELSSRIEFLETFMREGLSEVARHHDALFSRVDQKLDRLRREVRRDPGEPAAKA